MVARIHGQPFATHLIHRYTECGSGYRFRFRLMCDPSQSFTPYLRHPSIMSRTRKIFLFLLALCVSALLLAPVWMPLHPTTRAAYNIAEYRVRRWWWDRVGAPQAVGEGSLSGWVQDTDGRPVPDALVLVSTATGETFTTHSDQNGWYAIPKIPAGRYRPIAAAWDYDLPAHSGDANAGPMLHLGQDPQNFDAVLTPRTPPPLSPQPQTLAVGPSLQVETDFPTEAIAIRHAITFTH